LLVTIGVKVTMAEEFVTGIGNDVFLTFGICTLVCIVVATLFFVCPNEKETVLETMSEMEPDICFVCLQLTEHPCQTNCKHTLCCECMVELYEHKNQQRVSCPYCRVPIEFVLFKNTASLSSGVVQSLRTYNRRFSGGPQTITDIIRNVPTFAKMLWRKVRFGDRITIRFLTAIHIFYIGFCYFLSPTDFMSKELFDALEFIDGMIHNLLMVMIAVNRCRSALTFATGQWT